MYPYTKYRVISDSSAEHLSASVTSHLSDGWELRGPLVVVGFDRHNSLYSQAVVKK